MSTTPQNHFTYLVDQKRQRLTEAEALLARLEKAQSDVSRANLSVPRNMQLFRDAMATLGLENDSPGTAMGKLTSMLNGQRTVVQSLRQELADLERQRDELDEKAAEAIANGIDPATAYAQEQRKAELKALALQVGKYALITGVVVVLIIVAIKVYKRTAA